MKSKEDKSEPEKSQENSENSENSEEEEENENLESPQIKESVSDLDENSSKDIGVKIRNSRIPGSFQWPRDKGRVGKR